ncbi:MAG: HAD family hydrolase [Solobacterium sp.]|nr:HAD family hydrolase [Solobacterium sp.]
MLDVKYVLFDLDGTLLPMDQEVFVKAYFGRLCQYMVPYGYDPEKLIQALNKGLKAMIINDGSMTNEARFWESFRSIIPYSDQEYEHMIEFYETDFAVVKDAVGFEEDAKPVIEKIKTHYPMILATNPLFPRIATLKRIEWAGLDPNDFEYITSYEPMHYCKPNIKYYEELLEMLEIDPKDCLMVGNDVEEDMIVEELGMRTFLVDTCLMNPNNRDLSKYRKGKLKDLLTYLEIEDA